MPFVPAPNIIRMEILGLKDGQVIENVWHVNALHEPTPLDLQTASTQAIAFINSNYAPLLPNQVTITGVRATSQHVQNAPQLLTVLSIPGGAAGDTLPNETTYCISIRSNVIGRSARGRWFVLGVPTGNRLGENRVGATYRSNITNAVQNLIDLYNAVSMPFTIVSYRTNNAPRVGGPVYFLAVTATTTDDLLDSMRRRKPSIGV